ncbi:MAG TPA: hypothetical protein VNT79_09475, partial [Phycisphaerae bacterium]|nr:hypothetical protein [Phycisphaerae bacterium]
MIVLANWLALFLVLGLAQTEPSPPPVEAVPPEDQVEEPISNVVRVKLRPDKTIIPVGSPVFVEFVVQNKTGSAVTLAVPGAIKG